MLAVNDVVAKLKELKINALHIKLRGRGGKIQKYIKLINNNMATIFIKK
jgi:hypothetical protein